MSMVSHAIGTRFIQLIGGAMTSFYDWYADLPVACPQVFGDQTDVPESGDWWDSTYLMMWGSNVPVTRTPGRPLDGRGPLPRAPRWSRSAPDYADNTKFADEWLPAQAGTDAALAMAMGHVILKEFFVDRRVPFFVDYVQQYTDLPFLVRLEEHDGATASGLVPASSSPPPTSAAPPTRTPTSRPCCWTARRGSPGRSRTGRWASATPTPATGKWNLDLEGVDPALTLAG